MAANLHRLVVPHATYIKRSPSNNFYTLIFFGLTSATVQLNASVPLNWYENNTNNNSKNGNHNNVNSAIITKPLQSSPVSLNEGELKTEYCRAATNAWTKLINSSYVSVIKQAASVHTHLCHFITNEHERWYSFYCPVQGRRLSWDRQQVVCSPWSRLHITVAVVTNWHLSMTEFVVEHATTRPLQQQLTSALGHAMTLTFDFLTPNTKALISAPKCIRTVSLVKISPVVFKITH